MYKPAFLHVLGFLGHFGRVAEWQTRTVQVRVSVRTWGFNSPLAHQITLDAAPLGAFFICVTLCASLGRFG
jgi:hypothetical protein